MLKLILQEQYHIISIADLSKITGSTSSEKVHCATQHRPLKTKWNRLVKLEYVIDDICYHY